MKQHKLAQIVSILAVLLAIGLVSATAMQPESQALIQIRWRNQISQADLAAVDVPVYARLGDVDGKTLLAGASFGEIEALRSQGLDVKVLDADMQGASYYFVHRTPGHSVPDWANYGDLILDDGVQVLLRTTPLDADRLASAGLEVAAFDLNPVTLNPRSVRTIASDIDYIPLIASMIQQVDQSVLYQYEEWLTGEEATIIGGQPYTIETRYSHSTTPIAKATQFAFEHFEALGLETEYHSYALPGSGTRRNVIATQPGLTEPDDVYIICAHLDSISQVPTSDAPGADDNASGVTGVLMAADILSQYDFGCTLKFALWTGEEQGLHGSRAWAQWVSGQNLNVLGVLNMDMISYNSDASPIVDLHARSWLPDSVAMANLFSDVVSTYDLTLTPDILINNSLGNYSDNKPFWEEGYAAILAIEDHDDFTPHYHTTNDTLSTLNMPYFTAFVKASVGTFAHMGCLTSKGTLTGQVTDTSTGMPIAGATVLVSDQPNRTYQTLTNGAGYYTLTLEAQGYTVTATAPDYVSSTVNGVDVLSGQVTRQDLALEPKGPCVPPECVRYYLPLVVRDG